MAETGKVRILIADDFRVLRDVIRLHLERADDMDVVAEAPDLDHALEHSRMAQPDVIVMNSDLPPVDSAHAAALLRKEGSAAPILIVCMQANSDLIQRSFRSGANGFMYKDEIATFLVDAIRSVHRGERYISPKAQEVASSTEE
jgi:DNA-binding NarL/FixJ family response regulator